MTGRALLCLALFAASCTGSDDSGPVRVDVIGEAAALADPARAAPTESGALILAALAQGLVAIDAEGEIEPALAKRWTVLDDGLTYIFRLNDVVWPDGTALTAGQVARQLRSLRNSSRSRLAPLLADIEEVNAVTPQIVEIRLARPRIDFLTLLAQPDLAMVIGGEGLGPFVLADGYALDRQGPVLLEPYRSPAEEDDEEANAEPPAPIAPSETVELRFLPGALAVARFDLGQTDLVLGGRWTSLPFARAIEPAADQLVVDPVEGLFGLAFVEDNGFLAEQENRWLLSITINRDILISQLGDGAEARSLIVAPGVGDIAPRSAPDWLATELAARRQFGRARVALWTAANGPIDPIRVALPEEPGSRIVFAAIRNSWRTIGIEAERVGWGEDADLRLVDEIAASDSALWYLQRFACGRSSPCSQAYEEALTALAETRISQLYENRMAEAAAELEAMMPFIPLARPIRWSLVSPQIAAFRPNRHASHPLDTLRGSSD